MDIQVKRVEFSEVEPLRGLYRQEANCQIIHDSILPRGLADPYLIHLDNRLAGYGAIWNKYHPGRIVEFYAFPTRRRHVLPMLRELIIVSQATEMEAQTNMPGMLTPLYDCCRGITEENILFEDAFATTLTCADAVFRQIPEDETPTIFTHNSEPIGDWGIEKNGTIVATGGFLCHYNPPYGDIYMEVEEHSRQQGVGSYLIQELKRVCYEAGKKPSARCNPSNIPSRRSLEKAGMLPCGRLLSGKIAR